jgi:hypothetical protein
VYAVILAKEPQENWSTQSQCKGPRANASHRLPTSRCAKIEIASSAIFRATVQPCSSSVATAASASVLKKGISTATCTHASTRFIRERRHPPHAAPKSSPARPPSSLAPSRPRPQYPAGQLLGTPPGRPRACLLQTPWCVRGRGLIERVLMIY